MADRRTRRRRTRSDEKRAYIDDALEIYAAALEDCDGTCRAGRYCVQHGDLTLADLFEIEDAW
jgi:hypothetical protein